MRFEYFPRLSIQINVSAAILTLLAIASARVTFDHAEVLDHNDLTPGEKKVSLSILVNFF